MSDTASSRRPAHRSPAPGDAAKARPDDTPSTGKPVVPVKDDQPTIISSRPPMPTPASADSVYRILQGDVLPGDRLEHFDLVQYIGGGGMGRVFQAMDTRLARTVALKVLTPDQAADEETLLRFQNEAQSAARLDHENIARVYYVGEDRGLHFIAFEFIEGVNIRALVERKGPLSLAEAVSYGLQIAEALVHAAEREVVHRDVKPSNVLITPDGRVKLIDMGLARLRRNGTSAADLTASGVTLGTFDYISPEQARDPRNADVRSDIYSLGCTFFYMLAGQPPFPEGTVLQKLLQHQGDQPPDIRQFRPELPDEAARVLRKTLAKDPRDRYRFPAELVEDLTVLAEQIGLQPTGPGTKVFVVPPEPRVSFLHRHLPWIAPTAALFCIVTLLHLFWSSSDGQIGQLPPSPPPGKQDAAKEAPPDSENKGAARAQGTGSETPPQEPVALPETPNEVDPTPSDPSADRPPGPGGDPDKATQADDHSPSQEPGPAVEPSRPTGLGPADRFVGSRSVAGNLAPDPLGGGLSAAPRTTQMVSVTPEDQPLSGHLTGATGRTTEAAIDGPGPDPVPTRSGVLIVNDLGEGENEFRSLSAACSKATDGDVIELRYNGRREERPISLANVNVEIQAGKGCQPVVVFRPGKDEIDPVKYSRSMFTVTAGRVKLVNLAVELHLPREIHAEEWSLFETRGGPNVRLERCSLSICNASDKLTAYQDDVAFFRSKAAPGVDVVPPAAPAATPPATIDLLDCIARGEAVFVCAEDLQPMHLVWENGLFVTTERLLSAFGGTQAPQPGEMIHVDLRHLTAVVRSGLCRMADAQTAAHRLNAQIRCSDSIVMAAPGAPLIEQVVAAGSLDDFQQQIAWTGDGNFYEGFDVFWTICNLDREPLSEPISFEAWKLYWKSVGENLPHSDVVQFKKLPEGDRALHTHTPADYALGESTAENPNPAVGAAGGGRDAGLQADRLPQFPPLPVAEEPEPEPPPADRPRST